MPETLYWEDIEVGKTIALGEKRVEKDEIIAFAQEFDPQPFHLDAQAAKGTMIGELIASGWHTNVMLMRMLFDSLLKDSASLGSGGLEEVKWLEAVRPGDVIRGTYTCLESRTSKSRPGIGICRVVCEVINQDDQLVMSCRLSQFFRRRTPDDRQ